MYCSGCHLPIDIQSQPIVEALLYGPVVLNWSTIEMSPECHCQVSYDLFALD